MVPLLEQGNVTWEQVVEAVRRGTEKQTLNTATLTRELKAASDKAASFDRAMLQRFGLEPASVECHVSYPSLRGNCNACPVAGHCWGAMRRDAGIDECRAFCPNPAAFEWLAETA